MGRGTLLRQQEAGWFGDGRPYIRVTRSARLAGTIAHHLKILADAGIFTRGNRGARACYTLAPAALDGCVGGTEPGRPRDRTDLSPG
jgi:hypothetical protein